jgi:hypothetical protein
MKAAVLEKRAFPRVPAKFPVKVSPNLLGETINLSETGVNFILKDPLHYADTYILTLNLSEEETVQAEFSVAWHVSDGNNYNYGVRFTNIKSNDLNLLRQNLKKLNEEQIKNFFQTSLSGYIEKNYKMKWIADKLDQQKIMEIIPFKQPFLRIDKMIIFDTHKNIFQSSSLGLGTINSKDTSGYYNDIIFTALCEWLMETSAAIHLAVLFPATTPQVSEINGMRMFMEKMQWKPSANGNRFFVETCGIKEKRGEAVVNTKFFVGETLISEVTKLKFNLTPKGSIWEAKELPSV